MNTPTNFLEANALLAMQEGEHNEVWRALGQMFPGELRVLAEAARGLAWRADKVADDKLAAEREGS